MTAIAAVIAFGPHEPFRPIPVELEDPCPAPLDELHSAGVVEPQPHPCVTN